MLKIMIIRHAEKHQHGSHCQGISEDGRPSCHELTVRGWQRAAALVPLFTSSLAATKVSAVQPPRSIFASNATKKSPSLRAMHTAGPLAAALNIQINHDYAEDEESALAAAVAKAPSPVLIVWHHGHIPKLAKEIAGSQLGCPDHWPDDRFDIIWVLERHDTHVGKWAFSQVAQRLFPDDCPEIF